MRKVQFCSCDDLTDVSLLARCMELVDTGFSDCRALVDVSLLRSCPKLARLWIYKCPGVEEMSVLAMFGPKLETGWRKTPAGLRLLPACRFMTEGCIAVAVVTCLRSPVCTSELE